MSKMKRVVIGISESGQPYIVHKSNNVEVIFKKQKRKPFFKRIEKKAKTIIYQIKSAGL